MKRPVLVTGGGGFVGPHLVAHLRDRRIEVLAPARRDLDLADATGVLRYLRERWVHTVVHLAGRAGGIVSDGGDPVGSFLETVAVGSNVVRAAHAAAVPRLLNVSSSAVYPAGQGLLSEDDLGAVPLDAGNGGAALAEVVVGRICAWLAAGRPDRCYRTILPPHLYGPGDRVDRDTLPAGVVAEVARARRAGVEELEIPGDGTARRELLHVQDLCEVEHLLGCLDDVPPALNVGTGDDHSLLDLYTTAARVMGWRGRFVHDLDRPVVATPGRLDVSRLEALGWTARIDLEEGLRATAGWYEEQLREPAQAPA